MDASWLSSPINATFKVMAPENLDRSLEIEARSSAGKEASSSHKDSGCGPCHIECCRYKKVDEDFCVHDNVPSHSQCGEKSKGHDVEKVNGHSLLLPNQEGSLLGQKYAKRLIGVSSKKPKFDDAENCMKEPGIEGLHVISCKEGLDPLRCTLADKSQIIKLKRIHDGRKPDKKLLKGNLMNKYESLTSKPVLACSDNFSGGSNILGTQCSKSDLRHLAKSLDDELSIRELLDGSYKLLKQPVDKGKKPSNLNDNILLSVRKACSILSPPLLTENVSNVKVSQSPQDPNCSSSSDCETKDKQLEELLTKGQNSGQVNWSQSSILQPKDILKQLGLPTGHDLEASLFNPATSPGPVQLAAKAKSCTRNGLPPFPPWSTHSGISKPSIEFCKANSTKNLSHCKWVRIGSSPTSSCLTFKEFEYSIDSSSQQRINDVLQFLRGFNSNIEPQSNKRTSKPVIMEDSLETEVLETSCNPGKDSHGLKNKAVLMECRTVANESYSVSNMINGPSCSSRHLANWDKYRQVYSTDLLSAAETLVEMACSSDSTAAKHSSGRIKWPKTSSMKTMKVLKPSPSMEKPDRPFPPTGRNDTIKQTNIIPPAKHQPAFEQKESFTRPNSSGRDAVRWPSVPMSAAPPHKLENDLSKKFPHGNSTFKPMSPFSPPADKTHDNPIRKSPSKPSSSVAFEGSSIRDWIRGRNKR